MPVKIRLARHGKKGYAFYHIVVADSRAPRDGKFIEKIGTYNPNTNPATIDLNFDKALEWLQKGAQPTDTCRAILSYKGVMYKKHLLGGVAKGAFDEAAADAKFEKWMSEKAAKISAKTQKLTGEKEKSEKARLAAEKEANEKKAKAIEAKRAEAAAAAAAQTEEAEAPAEGKLPPPSKTMNTLETVGKVSKPFGREGELIINLYDTFPEEFDKKGTALRIYRCAGGSSFCREIRATRPQQRTRYIRGFRHAGTGRGTCRSGTLPAHGR